MKGFVITLVTATLIMLLVLFSTLLHNSIYNMERTLTGPQSLMYAAFLFDDVRDDLNSIAGPEITLVETNESMGILIADRIPKENFTGDLQTYETFLEDVIANQTHASIDANFSNMSSGTLLMIINEEYTYENDPHDEEMFFTSDGGTGATSYDINITVYEWRENLTLLDFNASGDMNISIQYTDLNGTILFSGNLFSDQHNKLEIEYEDGRDLYVDIGSKYGEHGSLWIKTDNTTADVTFYASLPAVNETIRTGYQYDATMDYEHGKVMMSKRIGK